MRLVGDTNVLISGLIWNGAPRELLTLIGQELAGLYISEGLFQELVESLHKPKLQKAMARYSTSADELLSQVESLANFVEPGSIEAVSRDPDDDLVLATAKVCRADLIVSGDLDLRSLGSYADIPIATPTQALERITARPSR